MTLTQKRAQASFRIRLLMHLAERKRQKGVEGFTLVELMIVVAVIGILSAVALPQFLQARQAAANGALLGSAVGLAKECGVLAASDIGAAPASATNIAVACGVTGGTVTVTMTAGPEGLRCLTDTSTTASATATITIGNDGATSCKFS